jgi:beta-1,4-mannosyl-glycoprotein beta-1,4-N-acetylglucosaminyltransferase
MKIIDCITYCGEDLLLKIRFETLYNQIDKFIIIEANKYFDGNPKPKFFDHKKFYKYSNKIEYYYIENLPKYNGNNLEYEIFIKNQIARGLNNLDDEDIVLISDADEIPNLKNDKFKNYDSAVFLQKMYYYKFNINVYEGLKLKNKIACTKSCKFKFFKSFQQVRQFRVKNIPWWRFDQKIKRYVEKDGGWHFSFLMNSEDIKSKLSRFEHEIKHLKREDGYILSDLMDINRIKNNIINLKDPYDRDHVKLKKVKIDESFPKYILENKDELDTFII